MLLLMRRLSFARVFRSLGTDVTTAAYMRIPKLVAVHHRPALIPVNAAESQ